MYKRFKKALALAMVITVVSCYSVCSVAATDSSEEFQISASEEVVLDAQEEQQEVYEGFVNGADYDPALEDTEAALEYKKILDSGSDQQGAFEKPDPFTVSAPFMQEDTEIPVATVSAAANGLSVKNLWASQHSVGKVKFKWSKKDGVSVSGWNLKYRTRKIGGNNSWSGWTTKSYGAGTMEAWISVKTDFVIEIHAQAKGDTTWSSGIITCPAGGRYQAMKATHVIDVSTGKRLSERKEGDSAIYHTDIVMVVGDQIRVKPDYDYPVSNYTSRPRLYPQHMLYDIGDKSMITIYKPDGSKYTGGIIDGVATITATKPGTTTIVFRSPNGRTMIADVDVISVQEYLYYMIDEYGYVNGNGDKTIHSELNEQADAYFVNHSDSVELVYFFDNDSMQVYSTMSLPFSEPSVLDATVAVGGLQYNTLVRPATYTNETVLTFFNDNGNATGTIRDLFNASFRMAMAGWNLGLVRDLNTNMNELGFVNY